MWHWHIPRRLCSGITRETIRPEIHMIRIRNILTRHSIWLRLFIQDLNQKGEDWCTFWHRELLSEPKNINFLLNLETPMLLEPLVSELFLVGLDGVSLGDLKIFTSLKFSPDFDWHHLESIEGLLWNGGGFAGHSSPAFLNWILNIPTKIFKYFDWQTFFSLFWGTDDKTLSSFRKTFWFLSGRAIIEKRILNWRIHKKFWWF